MVTLFCDGIILVIYPIILADSFLREGGKESAEDKRIDGLAVLAHCKRSSAVYNSIACRGRRYV